MNSKKIFVVLMVLVSATFVMSLASSFAQVDTAWVRRYSGYENLPDQASAIAVDGSGNIYVTGTGGTIKYDANGDSLWIGPWGGVDIAVDNSGNVYVTEYYSTVKYYPDGDTAWVRGYTCGYDDDVSRAVAVDGSGNVYVTGYSYCGKGTYYDFITIKYLPNGDVAPGWPQRYDGPISYDDKANDIAVDISGNVYVTGQSYDEFSQTYTTIKYYPNGDTAWVRRYERATYHPDAAYAIVVDGSSNVYVTGESETTSTARDYATIKYDSSGTQLWVERYNGPGNSTDGAYAIAIDDSGNVYVTGKSFGSGSNYDYATIKYDASGTQRWVGRYNGPGNAIDVAIAIAIDKSYSVCVTGYSRGSGTDDDYATIKYHPNGDTAWVRRYNGPGNSSDQANAIAVDGSGNVYVTGKSYGSGTDYDYTTLKYDPTGNELWVARYNKQAGSTDQAYALSVEGFGNVYVTGNRGTIKYDTGGTQLWVGPWGGIDIATDDFGNAYICGTVSNDIATFKYDLNGDTAWMRRYDGGYYDEAKAIALDLSGNVYVTGRSGSNSVLYDYITLKYYPNGDTAWVRRYNGPADSNDVACAIGVDSSGNVYVTGWSRGIGTMADYATIKYDPNGSELWVKRYDGPASSNDDAWAIAVDHSGNVCVTGESGEGGGTNDDYTTIKYYSNGDTAWVRRYDGPGNDDDDAFAISVDDSGNVYVTGESYGSVTWTDYATIKYHPNGDTAWIRRYNGVGNWYDYARTLTVDTCGNVYVTGSSWNGTNYDYVTVEYDSSGNEGWVRTYNGPGNGSDWASDIALNSCDNVYVTGWSWGIGTGVDYATIKYNTASVSRTFCRMVEPANWYDPLVKVTPGGSRELELKVFSIGNEPLIWRVSSDHACILGGGSGILNPGDSTSVYLSVNGAGTCDSTFIVGNVILNTNEGGVKYDTILSVQAVVANDYYECPIDSATVETLDNGVLRLYTNANCEERIFDTGTFPDTIHEVFFDGGTIIATTREGDTLVGRYMGTNDHKAGVRDKLYTESCSPDFWLVYTKNIFMHKLNPPMNPQWFWWEMSKQIKIFKNTAPDIYKHLVIKYITVKRHNPPTWWPTQPSFTGYENTYLGVAMDINCPSDTTSKGLNSVNLAGYDATNNIAYQRGFDFAGGHPEYNQYYCGIALANGGRPGESIVPYGSYNVNNNQYLYPQNGWGWKDGELYQLAANPLPADIQDPYSAVDRSWVFTARKIPAGNNLNATYSYTMVEVVAPGGLSQLRAYVDTARAIVTREKTRGYPVICGDVKGDDGMISLGDVTYLITYIYKGGVPPPCPSSRGDVNSSGGLPNLGDLIYLINYLYKAGPALFCFGLY